jgi:hypothetical protein
MARTASANTIRAPARITAVWRGGCRLTDLGYNSRMAFPSIFSSLVEKVPLRVIFAKRNSPTTTKIYLMIGGHVSLNELREEFEAHPVAVQEPSPQVIAPASIEPSSVVPSGSLRMVKTTNMPTQKEMELVQAARGGRRYNNIWNVQIAYDESGNVSIVSWDEN